MTARYYTSSALPTVLTSPLAASGNPVVLGLPGTWPSALSQYPFCVLIDWGTSAQEAVLVTGAPTGTGPYTLPVTRGIDGTTAQSHVAGAVVVHGTTGYEPALIQTQAGQIAALQGEIPSLPVAVNQGGTNAITAPAALANLGGAAVAGDLGGTSASPAVAKIQGTAISSPPGGTTAFLRGDGTWQVPPGAAATYAPLQI